VPLLTDADYIRKEPAITTYEKGNISVEKGDWNFIQYIDGSEELYNHAKDPKEFRNVINVKENHAIIKELRAYVAHLKKEKR
jgi:hypothetical protein